MLSVRRRWLVCAATRRTPCHHSLAAQLRHPRFGGSSLHTVAAWMPLRHYTPVYSPAPAVDHAARWRTEDEEQTLWATHKCSIPSIQRALEVWLRFGNDPVVDAALPPPAMHDAPLPGASTSPFSCVEDYMGTNLVMGSSEHVKESAELWSSYFEQKYLMRLRHSRRTAVNHIGKANRATTTVALTDEADQPHTSWAKDTEFSEAAYLSERHLKAKVVSLLQLEEVLWGTAEVEPFLAYFDALQQQTSTRIPLPAPSVWFYEGDARALWAQKYLPAAHDAQTFFQTILAPALKKMPAEDLLKRVAMRMKEWSARIIARHQRQEKAGIRIPWATATAEQKLEMATHEIDQLQCSIMGGVMDPEEVADTTEEWKTEHNAIEALLKENLPDCGFSLQDFWTNTLRREELETQHVIEDARLRRLAAAARVALYNEHPLTEVLAAMEEAIAKGELDLRSSTFMPHFNEVWSKLHYTKFGASSIAQHTHTASRQLLFHYASSPAEVAATARLYYATKPRSSHLDYASPYTLRRSIVELCRAYSLDMMHATQMPILRSCAHLARAEDQVAMVVANAAIPFGLRRRIRHAAARAANQRLLPPVKDVTIAAISPELLPAGAANQLQAPPTSSAPEPIAMWPLGSRQAIYYTVGSPVLEQMRLIRQAGPLTAERLRELERLRQQVHVEISLWRQRTPAEMEAVRTAAEEKNVAVAAVLSATPSMKEVQHYATSLFARLSHDQSEPSSTTMSEPDGEWEFAVMLQDNAPLNEEQQTEVFLPYTYTRTGQTGKTLPQATYRVRVRVYDHSLNPTHHPTLVSEAFSKPVAVFDALPQLQQQFLEARSSTKSSPKEGAVLLPGSDLIPLCSFLREAGLDVPLHAEFTTGQQLTTTKGEFSVATLFDHLRGTSFHRSCAEEKITDAQRKVELACRAHWELYHPGATEDEWAEARRSALTHAMEEERGWWHPDPMLTPRSLVAMSSGVEYSTYPATERYGVELCTNLEAESSATAGGDGTQPPLPPAPGVRQPLTATCRVDGTGAITSLCFSEERSPEGVDMEEVLRVARTAVGNARDRHSTLSRFKLGPMQRQAQVMDFCGVHGREMGGKYGRTYAYALEKAKRGLEEIMESGRGTVEEVVERSSESDISSTDRFASATHPEQRKTRFTPRTSPDGTNLEDPTPDQMSEWGR